MKGLLRRTDEGDLSIEVSTQIYETEAIIAASYKFTDRAYIFVDPISQTTTRVLLKTKGADNITLESIALEFCNELIDQQIRLDMEKQYHNIRDEIVRKAFSPIST